MHTFFFIAGIICWIAGTIIFESFTEIILCVITGILLWIIGYIDFEFTRIEKQINILIKLSKKEK